MEPNRRQDPAQEGRTGTPPGPGRSQAMRSRLQWHPSQGGAPPEPEAFLVEWQISADEEEGPAGRYDPVPLQAPALSGEEARTREYEARMFQRRLLRLYRACSPPLGGH